MFLQLGPQIAPLPFFITGQTSILEALQSL
jgi:hypothetical protein